MLKRAALLHLEFNQAALDAGPRLSRTPRPYNIQFRGREPMFVDLGSFRSYRQGEPWLGYGQFCRLFLYPLLIQAYSGISFQPLLRGSLDGIDPETANAMLKGQKLRAGVALDVAMQARAQRKTTSDRDVREELSVGRVQGRDDSGQSQTVRRHRSGVSSGSPTASTWSSLCPMRPRRHPAARKGRLRVKSLSANDAVGWSGTSVPTMVTFRRLAAEHADLVVAADADQLVVDRLYRDIVRQGPRQHPSDRLRPFEPVTGTRLAGPGKTSASTKGGVPDSCSCLL